MPRSGLGWEEAVALPTEGALVRTTGAKATSQLCLQQLLRLKLGLLSTQPRTRTAAVAADEAATGQLLPWPGALAMQRRRAFRASLALASLQPTQRGPQEQEPKYDSRDDDGRKPLPKQRLATQVLGARGVATAFHPQC